MYGAHLPLIHLDGSGWRHGELSSVTDAARDLGFEYLAANDHLVFSRPWLDGIVALASVIERSGGMRIATTVALPVLRGPVVLAKTAAALDILSGGRLVLGVGPGSSERDYRAAGLHFAERWRRLDHSLRVLRAHVKPGPPSSPDIDDSVMSTLEPRPVQAGGVPIWIGSWGSEAGLRRVAREGDGWIASAWNMTPVRAGAARETLGKELARRGLSAQNFPCSLATMFSYVTEESHRSESYLFALGAMLNRPVDALRRQLLVGPPEHCIALLRSYREAGMDTVFVWPLAEPEKQLERFMCQVVPFI